MNQKEKLIELLRIMFSHPEKTCVNPYGDNCFDCKYFTDGGCDHYARDAGYLIENGVIVLPCKVGDEFFVITKTGRIIKKVVTSIDVGANCECVIRSFSCFYFLSNIGKIIFFTHEDAEKALAERSKENE